MTLYEDMLKEHGSAAGALDALLAAFQLQRDGDTERLHCPFCNALRPLTLDRHCIGCGAEVKHARWKMPPDSPSGVADDPENLQAMCRTCNRSKGAHA